MKKDLAFDMIDPLNTEAKLKKYDAFFNKSLRSLQEFKKELSVDIEVSPSEISEIKNNTIKGFTMKIYKSIVIFLLISLYPYSSLSANSSDFWQTLAILKSVIIDENKT
ncbi:MAG: hypothetical protein Q9M36_11490 [Sulfurovum sp.]|nr:hypothetical protein [Sulfurovum sp.]